jgi:hypothetical protein
MDYDDFQIDFDVNTLTDKRYTPRREFVPTPEIAYLFDLTGENKDKKPGFFVKSLTGDELNQVEQVISERNRKIVFAILNGYFQSVSGGREKVDVGDLLEMFLPRVPIEHVKRLQLFVHGVDKPIVEKKDRLKIAKHLAKKHRNVFVRLTDKIENLSGLGLEVGE